MENYGSEIGQKMRSAVKAKLLELGTGGSTGYIDDELPDYVMIMVANKRPKQQMITDLNLFLGNQTELFVTWLHEVLQKLQEVTLPAAAPKKRKSSLKDDLANKKDKKPPKKDKKVHATKKSPEQNEPAVPIAEPEGQSTTGQSNSNETAPVITNITEVFAEDFLEKAKKTMDITATAAGQIKKSKAKRTTERLTEDSQLTEESRGFDIPTISEISSTTGAVGTVNAPASAADAGNAVTTGNREKDLAELAAIQRKIYAAKKLLKEIGELNDAESDDEDFLNLKDDGSADEFNEAGDLVTKPQKARSSKPKSPIVCPEGSAEREEPIINAKVCDSSESSQMRQNRTPAMNLDVARPDGKSNQSENSRKRDDVDAVKKRPVHQRLGLLPTPTERESSRPRQRQEKELYVPSFRRRELDGERVKELSRHNESDKGRDRERHKDMDRKYEDKNNSRNRRPSADCDRFASQEKPKLSRQEYQSKRIIRNDESGHRSGGDRNRIGSRVIVAPAKKTEPSDDEDLIDKAMNSVIKIKPRTPISPSKQACKNLLLRAVAEAQRSTILSKPLTVKKDSAAGEPKLKRHLGNLAKERKTRLSLHNRLKHQLTSMPASELFRRTTKSLVIEVERNDLVRSNDELMNAEDAKSDSNEIYELDDMSKHEDSSADGEFIDQVLYNTDDVDENSLGYLDKAHKEPGCAYATGKLTASKVAASKTQFVVTLNDKKAPHKYNEWKHRSRRSRSASPLPKVSSSSSITKRANTEAQSRKSRSRSRDRYKSRQNIKARLSLKASSSLSPNTAGRESSHSSITSNTPPPRRTEFIEIYRKPMEIKKIIIQNDSEDDEGPSPKKFSQSTPDAKEQNKKSKSMKRHVMEDRSTTPPLPPTFTNIGEVARSTVNDVKASAVTQHDSHLPVKRRRTPIKFDLDNTKSNNNGREANESKRRSNSRDDGIKRDDSLERHDGDERRRISIRNAEIKKYDNIPSLNSLALESSSGKVLRPKERCKYHPNCTKQFCEFYHPSAPCKSFPNCKYADKCMYSHPKCKYDMSCTNIDCSFSHSGQRNPSQLQHIAPPISSHVVPVQNYKSITAVPLPAIANTMCKYYPNCNKVNCTFYHPKPCRFGKNCINKLECNFYHHEVQSSSKFKWVSSLI